MEKAQMSGCVFAGKLNIAEKQGSWTLEGRADQSSLFSISPIAINAGLLFDIYMIIYDVCLLKFIDRQTRTVSDSAPFQRFARVRISVNANWMTNFEAGSHG